MKRKGSISNCFCSTPQPNSDSSFRKRVKFKHLDCDGPSSCRKDVSAIPLKERQQPNNAKTSEFAFFKKFKEDASLKFNSSPLHQKEIQSKKFKSSDHFRERTSLIKDSRKGTTSHFLVENVTPVNSDFLHSGLGNSFKNSDCGLPVEGKPKRKQNGLPLVPRALCFSEEVDVKQAHATWEDIQSEQRNMESNDIFNIKRQKLLHFTRNMSFHGTGESYEKGYGFVSLLLSRLIPQNNSVDFEKQQLLPVRSFSRLDHELSPFHLNKSRGRDLSYPDTLTNSADDNNFHLKYRAKESYCGLEEVTLLDFSSSSVTAAVKNCGPLTPRFKPLGGLYDQDEPFGLREHKPKALLLGWDTDNIKYESSYSSQLKELDTFAMPPVSFSDDHQPNFQQSFGAVGLCPSPFPSSNSRNFYSLPYSSLASYEIHRLSTHDIKKKEEIAAYFNNFNLNFSYIPKCPTQCANYIDSEGSSNPFSTQSGHWFVNHLFDDRSPHSHVQTLCASGFVLDLGSEYFSNSKNHCKTAYLLEFPFNEVRSEDPVDEECNYGSSDNAVLKDLSSFLQPELFLQKDEVCHLLPHNLSWNAAENELNVDKTEFNYI